MPQAPAGATTVHVRTTKQSKGVSVEETLVSLFERQVGRFPTKTAIKSLTGACTYDELNRRANRIAHALLALRGDKEEPVVLFFRDNIDSITATLGALKAGKIYVPLDPSVPRSRCMSIARDTRARIVLTTSELASSAEELAGADATLILTDELDPAVSDRNPDLSFGPERLASLYYTSGSTGDPKGVPTRHRGRVGNYKAYTDALSLTENDRLVLLYSCTFSGVVNNLFGALLNGGTLCPFDVARHGISSLARWLEQERITVYHSVPSLFRSLVEAAEQHSFSSVRVVMLASDTLYERDVEAFRNSFPRTCRLCNMWGVSESSFIRPYWIGWDQEVSAGPVPSIGPTVGDDEILVLDESGTEVAVGKTGEIVLRGENLTPGYWRNPELTRRRFIPDPENPEIRRYYTGDLGRRLADGAVLHLGRNDFQVKIRGFRIELEEIEGALRQLPGINIAAVVASDFDGGEKRLVAHLTLQAGERPAESDLRAGLRARLPSYMIPERFVFHDELAVTSAGKVDRHALGLLPIPHTVAAESRGPQTNWERELTPIWRDVLGDARIGVHENFFDLGGDSLKAIRIALAIEKRLNRGVPPAMLIERPTIEKLARALADDDAAPSSLVPLQCGGSRPPLFCVHGSGGHVFFYRDLAKALGPGQPVYGLQAAGLDGSEAPLTDVATMAERYVDEIRRVEPHGPYRLSGFCTGAYIAVEMASILRKRGEDVAFLASFNADGEWKTAASGLRLHAKRLRQLRWTGKLHYTAERYRYRWIWVRNRVGALLARWQPSRFARFRVEVANDTASSNYVPTPFPGRVVLFQARMNSYADPKPFWGPLAHEGIDVRQVPGDNETMLHPPNVDILARELRSSFEAVRLVEQSASSGR